MQHKAARERKDGNWDYTIRWDNRIVPIGYCAGYVDPDDMGVPMNPNTAEMIRQFKDKHHTDGHATAEDACNCYKEYLLDHNMQVHKTSEIMRKCVVCDDWTNLHVSVGGYQSFVLCKAHANREEVSKLFEVGESWES